MGVARISRRGAIAASGGGAGGSFAVGSFEPSGTTGTQAVTGVGFTPKAIVFWTSGGVNLGAWSSHVWQSIGFTSGPTESYSVSGASQDGQATSNTGRRIAAKAVTVSQFDGSTVLAEADLSSFDADGFTLNWTTGGASALDIMFMAIGGSGVSAKVVNWTSPTAVGNKAVTGVGFTPDLVLHATSILTTTPSSSAGMTVGFGAMDAAGAQWANAIDAQDAVATSNTSRYQRTDKCLASLNGGGGLFEEAAFVSMDADGFTTNFTSADTSAWQYVSLCLSGVSAKVGNFAKSTAAAPASQSITGVGFQPTSVLLSSVSNISSTAVNAHAAWNLGGGDGTNERAAAQVDLDAQATTNAGSYWDNAKVFVEADSPAATGTEADLTSLDADGFTLNWTKNNAAANEVLFLALQ